MFGNKKDEGERTPIYHDKQGENVISKNLSKNKFDGEPLRKDENGNVKCKVDQISITLDNDKTRIKYYWKGDVVQEQNAYVLLRSDVLTIRNLDAEILVDEV